MDKDFIAGAIHALGVIAMQNNSDVEIRNAICEMDFIGTPNPDCCSNGSPFTRDQLVEAGADIYDAEQVVACLECREPEEV